MLYVGYAIIGTVSQRHPTDSQTMYMHWLRPPGPPIHIICQAGLPACRRHAIFNCISVVYVLGSVDGPQLFPHLQGAVQRGQRSYCRIG